MKKTIVLLFCASLMCVGASMSWTRQPKQAKGAKQKAKGAKQKAKSVAKRKTPSTAPTSKRTASRPAPTKGAAQASQKALKALLKKGIEQIKAKKYEAFLKRFISPEDKAKIFNMMSLKQLAPRFGQHKARILLAALTWSLTQTPTFDAKKQRATFSLKGLKTPTPKKMLIFVHVKGKWYIKD